MNGKKANAAVASEGAKVCRCEATIAPAILEGYACGNPACWRTPIVQASFDAFVTDLVRARDDAAPGAPAGTH